MKVFLLLFLIYQNKPIIRMIHGFLAPCILEEQFLENYFPNYDKKCVESGLGLIFSFESEIKTAC